jgi:hypothetical protein
MRLCARSSSTTLETLHTARRVTPSQANIWSSREGGRTKSVVVSGARYSYLTSKISEDDGKRVNVICDKEYSIPRPSANRLRRH